MSAPLAIRSIAEFLTHALAIEREAAARYLQFADAMLEHNNPEVAALFEKLAKLEAAHHEELHYRARGQALPLKPWEYRWLDPESPESAPLDSVHYLMSPREALEVALANEGRAWAFFDTVANAAATPGDVRTLAREYADDELTHMGYLEHMLDGTPEPIGDWGDPDPAIVVD